MSLTTLPNPNMDFTPLNVLTADEMDDLVENIEAINNCTIQTGSIANGAITKAKLAQDAFQNYSTSEVDTGATWIDGKKIYKKTIDCGAEPAANSSKEVPINIPNYEKTIKIEGIMLDDDNSSFPLPDTSSLGAGFEICVYDNNGWVIYIGRANMGHGVTHMYVTLYYTKTS